MLFFASKFHVRQNAYFCQYLHFYATISTEKTAKSHFIVDLTLIFAAITTGNDALPCATLTQKPEVALVASYRANRFKIQK